MLLAIFISPYYNGCMHASANTTPELHLRERFPMPGQRILRSVVAVWLCLAVYLLRGRQGYPVISMMAALQCIQPYNKDIRMLAKERVIGTLTGTAWGLLFLYAERALVQGGLSDGIIRYCLIGLCTGAVLYFTVVLKVTDVAFFSAITFLPIVFDPVTDASLIGDALFRTLDTLTGIALGTLVNMVQLPRRRNTDILFASGVGEFLVGSGNTMTPYSKVELNRLIEDGAKFTISTMQTPATVRELLKDIRLRYPIVTMDGAVLYDMQQLSYLKTNPMPAENARRLINWLDENDLPFFSNCIEEDLLVIRYEELANPAMRKIYDSKHTSPHRNYLHGKTETFENIVYVLVVEKTEKIRAACEAFVNEPWANDFRLSVIPGETDVEGYTGLKFYDVNTSQEAMLKELAQMLGTKETVTCGFDAARYDVVASEKNPDQVVKEIRDRFEPVDLRGWKHILRF